MKFTIVFLLLACILSVVLAGKPRPYSPRPTSHPRPIRVRRHALGIDDIRDLPKDFLEEFSDGLQLKWEEDGWPEIV